MMGDYEMARGGNGGRDDYDDEEFMEDLAEIPHFEDNDNGEMMDDRGDGFERRFRAAYYDDERALHRVPSVLELPPVEDFLNGEDEGDHSHLDGWANETLIHHGDLGDILRQMGEENPMPLDPEPPHAFGIEQDFHLQFQMWLEEPLVFEHQMFIGESVANTV